jgi:hypothetical protein
MKNTLTLARILAVGQRPASSDPSEHAIARCWNAYTARYQEARDHKTEEWRAINLAEEAYKSAMPTLGSRENIRAFVACVAHGVLAEVFDGAAASKLLYAAQVAISTLGGKQ